MPVDMTKVAAAAGTMKTPTVSVGLITKIMNDVTFEDQWAQLSMLGYEHQETQTLSSNTCENQAS